MVGRISILVLCILTGIFITGCSEQLPGTLVFVGNPEQATVYESNRNLGRTPLRLDGVPSGRHYGEIRKEGYFHFGYDVVVKPGQESLVEYRLVPFTKTVIDQALTLSYPRAPLDIFYLRAMGKLQDLNLWYYFSEQHEDKTAKTVMFRSFELMAQVGLLERKSDYLSLLGSASYNRLENSLQSRYAVSALEFLLNDFYFTGHFWEEYWLTPSSVLYRWNKKDTGYFLVVLDSDDKWRFVRPLTPAETEELVGRSAESIDWW